MMKTYEIRRKYIDFFKKKGHEEVESDTLAPKHDPTLLFTGAGMNQFKEQFIGRNITYRRAVSCQKCLRTGDLENVGKTSSHHTFFEMLGNFSFGDYFKREACKWAWEFMTDVLKIPEDKLWVTVYKDDKEAFSIWEDDIKLPVSKIIKMGAKDNFWPANAPLEGPNGPCGPCSEIFYDHGFDAGCGKSDCTPACDCGRFVEVWNLVFTQFNRAGKNDLQPLPSKNIDTGMGLERMASVMQGVRTNFDIDIFSAVIKTIRENTYELPVPETNAIADHVRAAVFSICDGIIPSNEERGYVIRKLIRRAALMSKKEGPFLFKLVPDITGSMKDAYPELNERRENIAFVIKEEEVKFYNALASALPKLENIMNLNADTKMISGEDIFKLVDTYGLPLEVIEKKAKDEGYTADMDVYSVLMEKRREESRNKSKIEGEIFVESVFAGAPQPETSNVEPISAVMLFMAKGDQTVNTVSQNERFSLITDPQCGAFYAESGGQVGDTGVIKKNGGCIRILNTHKFDNKIVHECVVINGCFKTGENVEIELDKNKNKKIAANHTATHLLHSALRKVLGDHVKQAGSLVESDRLRFDFTHTKKLSEQEISRVDDLVNAMIRGSLEVKKEIKTRDQAVKEGAIALFGEKYGKNVRVVTIGENSQELCGGTHVENTKEIGLFKIVSESSIASGVRRIEACTGEGVSVWLKNDIERILNEYREKRTEIRDTKDIQIKGESITKFINEPDSVISAGGACTWEQLSNYTQSVRPVLSSEIERLSKEKKRLEKNKKKEVFDDIGKVMEFVLNKKIAHNGVSVIAANLENVNMAVLRSISDNICKSEKSSFVVLGSKDNGKARLVIALGNDLVNMGMDASSIIREAAALIGGSGGGRKDFAQAGGKESGKLDMAVEKAKELFISKFGDQE